MRFYEPIDGHRVEFLVVRTPEEEVGMVSKEGDKPKPRGVVTAKIKGCKGDVQQKLFSTTGVSFSNAVVKKFFTKKELAYCEMPESMKAVAKCMPEDEFNEDLGKDLAYLRLKRNYHRSMQKRLSKASELLDRMHNGMFDLSERARKSHEGIDPMRVLETYHRAAE